MKALRLWGMLACAALLLLTACKPTEKNYKSAYDAAQSKLQSESVDPDLGDLGIELEGAPGWRVVEGDSVRVSVEPLKLVSEGVMKPFNVAVGQYRMRTNAFSQVENLCGEGMDAAVLQTLGDRYYVAAERFDTLEEAARWLVKYMKKNKSAIYPGMPYGPVVVENER